MASTKAFTTQLTVLLVAAMDAGRARGSLSQEDEARLANALIELPAHINTAINMEEQYKRIAEDILAEARDVLYMGRGSSFPIALEGALKLKEISYIHAEGYAGGEMKHGPIALIDEAVPVVVVAPTDAIFDKIASNFEQVKARGGKLVLLSDAAGNARLGGHAAAAITLPTVDPMVAPILYTVPVQLLAYHTALAKGTDVDQPRNLAKSVTGDLDPVIMALRLGALRVHPGPGVVGRKTSGSTSIPNSGVPTQVRLLALEIIQRMSYDDLARLLAFGAVAIQPARIAASPVYLTLETTAGG